MTNILENPLTPAQLEILKVLAIPMSEEEIIALKRHIVRFFADRLTKRAAEVWDENNWKEQDTERLRERHFRASIDKKS
jgi:hypothetical protein